MNQRYGKICSEMTNNSRNQIINKFELGDTVRISRIKGIFEHGFLPNWTEQIYKIHIINMSTSVTYILKDLQDELIEGGFYNEELQKTSQEVFRIEKVLREENNQWNRTRSREMDWLER